METNNTNQKQGIIRKAKKEINFAQISNDLINNKRLSYKALGILVYILSKPDDWQVYMSDLIREDLDGEKSVRNGINELIEKNYIQRYRVYNNATGKVNHWETLVSETPFKEEELISSVKETYALKDNGEIAYQKMKVGNFERYFPIVIEREVTLLCQKGKVEEDNNEITTFPKPTNRKATSRKRRTTNTNKTNINKTNIDISSSSKGKAPNSIHPLIELFNSSICELKNTTLIKFQNYIQEYNEDFIEAVINYCEERNGKSFTYFEKTIQGFIEQKATTPKLMEEAIDKFNSENKTKKNNALKAKDEKKQEEAFEQSINDRIMEDLAKGFEPETAIAITGEDINNQVKNIIKPKLSETLFNTWIKSLDFRFNIDTVIIGCPNSFTKEIVDKRYINIIMEAISLLSLNKKLKTIVMS